MEDIICVNCGSVNDYWTSESGPHIKATCNGCDKYIKMLPQKKSAPMLHFGKFKGREIKSLTSQEEREYLNWLQTQAFIKPDLKKAITSHLATA